MKKKSVTLNNVAKKFLKSTNTSFDKIILFRIIVQILFLANAYNIVTVYKSRIVKKKRIKFITCIKKGIKCKNKSDFDDNTTTTVVRQKWHYAITIGSRDYLYIRIFVVLYINAGIGIGGC